MMMMKALKTDNNAMEVVCSKTRFFMNSKCGVPNVLEKDFLLQASLALSSEQFIQQNADNKCTHYFVVELS